MASSAVMAVLSIPAVAQEAAPSLELPDTVVRPGAPAAPVDTPTIIPPATSAEPTVSTPPAANSQPTVTLPAMVSPTGPVPASPTVAEPSAAPETVAAEEAAAPAEQARTADPVAESAAASNEAAAPQEPASASRAAASVPESAPNRAAPAQGAAIPAGTDLPAGANADGDMDAILAGGAGLGAIGSGLDGDVPAAAEADVPAAEPAVAEPASDADGSAIPGAAIAGLLGVAVLGGAGLLATRSRRRRREEPADEMVRRAPIEPLAAEPAMAAAAGQPVRREKPTAPPGPLAPQPSTTRFAMPPANRAGAPVIERPVATPERQPVTPRPFSAVSESRAQAGPVPNGEARRELLEQMVAAEPDKENPFTSAKARRRRARCILAHREHLQREQTPEPFDWRTHPSATSNSPRTTPPLVTA